LRWWVRLVGRGYGRAAADSFGKTESAREDARPTPIKLSKSRNICLYIVNTGAT